MLKTSIKTTKMHRFALLPYLRVHVGVPVDADAHDICQYLLGGAKMAKIQGLNPKCKRVHKRMRCDTQAKLDSKPLFWPYAKS